MIKEKKELIIECHSAECNNPITNLLVFDDKNTKLIGSCSDCLSKTPGFDFGYLDMYRKYENFEILSFDDIDKIKIRQFRVKCGLVHCYESSTHAFVGIIKVSSIGYIYLFYRCKEHFMKNSKKWKNVRVIEI